MKRVAIIMPAMNNADPGWWREAIASLEGQSYPIEYMHLFQVVRHVPGVDVVVPVTSSGMGMTVIPFPCGEDKPPTVMEQVAVGFDRAKDYDYIVTVGCNDVFKPSFIWWAVDALEDDDIAVSYSGYTILDKEGDLNVPLWCDLDKRGFGSGNPIPDFSMFRPWVAEWFDPETYGRAAFYVMWTELFLRYGSGAFRYVPRISYKYRNHGGVSQDKAYLSKFRDTATKYLRSKGLMLPEEELASETLASLVKKHPMEGAA